jgi:hypothetical protein
LVKIHPVRTLQVGRGYPVEVIMREEIAFEYCQKIILNFNPNHWKVVSSSFVDPERNQEGLSLDFLKKLDFISCASHRVKNEFPLFNVQIYPFRSSESDHTLILLEIDTPAGIIYLLENEKYSNCFFKEVVDV